MSSWTWNCSVFLQLSKQLDQFKDKLESFAVKHQEAIRKDPAFREHFQEMCATIGVDPLASSKGKSRWHVCRLRSFMFDGTVYDKFMFHK